MCLLRDWDKFIDLQRERVKNLGVKKAVIGVSGGCDSTVSLALLVRLLGKDNVYAILLPNGEQSDINDSYRVCDALGVSYEGGVNIGNIYDLYKETLNLTTQDALINLAPRVRMTVLRAKAQEYGAFLCGTGNLSEYTTGYFTKDGDSCYDFNMIIGLTKSDVVSLGKYLTELPVDLVEKAPSDGLSGVTDEEKLGVEYWKIDTYIKCKDIKSGVDYRLHLSDADIDRLQKLEVNSRHKRSKFGLKAHSGNIVVDTSEYVINKLGDNVGLLVVDWQNDFVDKKGSLSCSGSYSKTARLIDLMLATNKENLFMTKDVHTDCQLETAYDGSKIPKHCVKDTWGAEFYGNIDSLVLTENIIKKDSFGCVGLSDFIKSRLGGRKLDKLYVVGVATDICVQENVLLLKDSLEDTEIVAVEDLCVGTTKENHYKALDELRAKGITVC